MTTRVNEFDQPIGPAVPDWTPRERPSRTPMTGRYCRIEPLDAARHASDLWHAYRQAPDSRDWTYLFVGPFADFDAFRADLEKAMASADPLHHAIIDTASGKPVGTAALMRIEPAHGVIEIGSIGYSPLLKRTPAATEAMVLFMRRAFDELGYRRYEWKCDDLNAPSRAAALRLGFRFEGIFRQAIVYKGRSRDTAWYSITDREWPALRDAFDAWLDASNFDSEGRQRRRLSDLTARARA